MRRKPKYTIEEIRQRITPIAKRYGVKRVSLFGSYARNEACAKSDVDLLIDDPDKKLLEGFFRWGGLYSDLQDALKSKIDLVMTTELDDDKLSKRILKDEVLLYERA